MLKVATTVIAVALAQCLWAQAQDPVSRAPSRIGFPWFLAPKPVPSGATMIAPDAMRIMQRDGQREARKERAYWDKLRVTEERRIRDRYRVETEVALQRALAVAAARQVTIGSPSVKTAAISRSGTGGYASSGDSEEAGNNAHAGEPKDLLTRAAETATAVKDGADKVVKTIDRAVDALVPPSPSSGQAETRRTSGVVFFLLLLALFLVPSFAVALLLLGVIHLRNGHRLQAGIFSAVGGAVLLLVFAAVQEMRGENKMVGQADTARWRAECKDSAVRLTGFVYEPTTEGMIVNNVSGAPVDEYGCALVLTSRTAARSGDKWELLVYPVGLREAPNAIGLVRPIPAYAESLDQAVAWRADEEKASSEWWWQRVLRSIRKA